MSLRIEEEMEETEETEESEEEEEDVLEEEEEESLLPNRFNKSFNASGSVFFFGGNPYFLRMNELLFGLPNNSM